MSDSATLWTVARQAPLSMAILQARILELGCHDLAVSQQLTCRLEKGAPGYWNKGVLICERQMNRGKDLTPKQGPGQD